MRFQKPTLASNTRLAGRQIKNTSQRDAFGFEISAFVSVIKIQAILKFDRVRSLSAQWPFLDTVQLILLEWLRIHATVLISFRLPSGYP